MEALTPEIIEQVPTDGENPPERNRLKLLGRIHSFVEQFECCSDRLRAACIESVVKETANDSKKANSD